MAGYLTVYEVCRGSIPLPGALAGLAWGDRCFVRSAGGFDSLGQLGWRARSLAVLTSAHSSSVEQRPSKPWVLGSIPNTHNNSAPPRPDIYLFLSTKGSSQRILIPQIPVRIRMGTPDRAGRGPFHARGRLLVRSLVLQTGPQEFDPPRVRSVCSSNWQGARRCPKGQGVPFGGCGSFPPSS